MLGFQNAVGPPAAFFSGHLSAQGAILTPPVLQAGELGGTHFLS